MEFLVRQSNRLPPDMPAERQQEINEAERTRAMELRDAGLLVKL